MRTGITLAAILAASTYAINAGWEPEIIQWLLINVAIVLALIQDAREILRRNYSDI